jgi:hypothetical protein
MLGTGGNVTIKSNTTGNTFTLFTTPVTQDEAQQECTAIGGHLASYATLDEQVEMEYAFINSGYLLPGEQPEQLEVGCGRCPGRAGVSALLGRWPGPGSLASSLVRPLQASISRIGWA